MLDVMTRQQYFKDLGWYRGEVDGIENDELRQVYADYQKAYFLQKSDWDGIYGTKTNRLLINHHNVWLLAPDFDIVNFRCGCEGQYCNGYPVLINTDLLTYLQNIRTRTGVPTTISSGMHCSKYNDFIEEVVENSKNKQGKGLAFYNSNTDTLFKRKTIMNQYGTEEKMNFSKCNGYYRTKTLGGYEHCALMGSSIYIDVK